DADDLILQKVTPPDPIIEDKPHTITIIIKNTGTTAIPAGTNISDHLYINTATTPKTINWTDDGLSAKASRYLNLTWIPSITDITLIIRLYCDGTEVDDVYIPITVQKKDTDIVLNTLIINGTLKLDEQLTIIANTTNTGKSTTTSVKSTLIINNKKIQNQTIFGMDYNESYNFTFKWTPKEFGYYTINVTLDPNNKIPESNETNNYQEETIFIQPYHIDWYSPHWHYRKFITINGTGTIAIPLDFTELLNDLGITQKTFENTTILPILYKPDGSTAGKVLTFDFNESTTYHPQTNAKGNVLINTTTSITYLCIYFDVKENDGTRPTSDYTPNIYPMGNTSFNNDTPPEGWWTILLLPENNFYPLNLPSDIKATTITYANKATVTLYYKGTFQTTLALNTTNKLSWKKQYTFTKTGNWTIHLVAEDKAGYTTPIIKSANITVQAIPDLSISKIIFPTENITEGTPASIKIIINNTGTVDAIKYELRLYTSQNVMKWEEQYLRDTIRINISKQSSKTFTLTWNPSLYGTAGNLGKWIAGIWIITDLTHPDINTADNKQIKSPLIIKQGEQNPPKIEIINLPDTIEKGQPITIQASITDASGLRSVNITIFTPQDSTFGSAVTKDTNDLYTITYTNTFFLGKYTFRITAIDNSFYQKQTITTGAFTVIEDATPPTIEFTGIFPDIQLTNTDVTFICITYDLSGLSAININLLDPDGFSQTISMIKVAETNKYRAIEQFSTSGQYSFSITVKDQSNNAKTTDTKTFWITSDLNDTDDDGMPDRWEKRYGLDPFDPTDATQDLDKDGISNLEEYQKQTNPTIEPTFAQEFSLNLKNNAGYLATAILLTIIIITLSLYTFRRR
ncbi:MAG: hypothetical protein KKC68_08315, partial [Candidatus Thermoplasmatota archaeon]|nr:hypothetical protein [Candidatus Thermoplasmatota archaeon]MBU1941763.1 hypothetical protein [Candidatus Thermoplasmatota archaeon]